MDERPQLQNFEGAWSQTAWLPDPSLTIPEVLALRFAEAPDEPAFHVVRPDGRDLTATPVTFTQLWHRAQAAARALKEIDVSPGDRVLLSVTEADAFFPFFFGAQAIGAIPVPLPSLSDMRLSRAFSDRIESVAADCRPSAVVVESNEGCEAAQAVIGAEASIIDVGSLDLDDDAGPTEGFDPHRRFDEIAFIQYTSGSTGSPKGVVIDHYNLVANLRAIIEAARFCRDDISFSWLPLFHDMGLIGGFLVAFYVRGQVYSMATRHFVARPDRWLRGISAYRATFTVSPNFAYSIAARKLPDATLRGLDLSCLRLAFNGAEPIDRETTEKFSVRFEPYGFRRTSWYPVYGLAEHTLGAAFPEPETPPVYDFVDRRQLVQEGRAVAVPAGTAGSSAHVSVGSALPAHRLRVVQIDGSEEMCERQVGEIVATGPSISQGYYGHELQSDRELRTGDLGYVADGRLYVVDRIKDLVIVAGRNLAPSDIERSVATVPGVSLGGVVALGLQGDDGTEELHLIVTCDPRSWRRLEHMRQDVRRAVQECFEVAPKAVCFVPPGTIPKTSSGKVQRHKTKQLYVAGTLPRVETVAQRAAIKAQHLRRRTAMLLAR